MQAHMESTSHKTKLLEANIYVSTTHIRAHLHCQNSQVVVEVYSSEWIWLAEPLIHKIYFDKFCGSQCHITLYAVYHHRSA